MKELDISVERHMRAPVQTIPDTEQLSVAARVMDENGISALPVLDASSRLTGVLQHSDLMRLARLRGRDDSGTPLWSLPEGSVAEHMQSSVPVIAAERPLRECARRMVDRGLHHVYVVRDRELVGLVGTREILLAVAGAELDGVVGELGGEAADAIEASAPVEVATARCAQSGTPLVVVERGSPVGVFTLGALGVALHSHPRDATGLWMDRALLPLPADTPPQVAARRALDSGARYIVVQEPSGAYRVVTRLSFAARIAGASTSVAAPPVAIGKWDAAPAPVSTPSTPAPRRGALEDAVRATPGPAPSALGVPAAAPAPDPAPSGVSTAAADGEDPAERARRR